MLRTIDRNSAQLQRVARTSWPIRAVATGCGSPSASSTCASWPKSRCTPARRPPPRPGQGLLEGRPLRARVRRPHPAAPASREPAVQRHQVLAPGRAGTVVVDVLEDFARSSCRTRAPASRIRPLPTVRALLPPGGAMEMGVPGTGLGLAIAKSVAEAHDGFVDIVDTPGWSTTFRVFLPLRTRPTRPRGALDPGLTPRPDVLAPVGPGAAPAVTSFSTRTKSGTTRCGARRAQPAATPTGEFRARTRSAYPRRPSVGGPARDGPGPGCRHPPRDVRRIRPHCRRKGSYASSMVSVSSPTHWASVVSPIG